LAIHHLALFASVSECEFVCALTVFSDLVLALSLFVSLSFDA
jgi:hypothetical protein